MPAPISVELVPHSPEWAERAAHISAQVTGATGDLFLAIHHIGSTSIPGIAAKPIIDLLPVARSLAALDAAQSAIEALGFNAWGEYGLPGRRYFTRDDPESGVRLVNMHCWAESDPAITRHLAFRDYLRAHSAIAAEYGREKARCAALHPLDSHAYTGCKNDWIARVQADAVRAET